MLAFTLRRAIQAIGVLIAVGIISFSMFRFAGDPVNQMVAIDTSAAERADIRKSLGLDDPVVVQFARYVVNAAQFKFGVSYQFRQPVANLLTSSSCPDVSSARGPRAARTDAIAAVGETPASTSVQAAIIPLRPSPPMHVRTTDSPRSSPSRHHRTRSTASLSEHVPWSGTGSQR